MTIEADDILHQYTVTGIGPYAVEWPYLDGGLIVSVSIDGIVTPIDAVTYTVDPIAGASGNVFLTAPAAAAHAGRQLFITRETPAEQGWQGVLGEREKGLEVQLDRLVMLLQELKQQVGTTLRLQGAAPQPAYVTGDGVLMWDGTTLKIGPDADLIAAAQDEALAAATSASAAAASAAAAATFNPALFLAKADNLAGLGNVLTALQSGLGFSAYMAGLRSTASKAALQTALDLLGLAYKSSVTFTDMNGAAVRLSSEGYTGPTDAEFPTTAWVEGYLRSAKINLGTSLASTSGTAIDFTGIPSWAKRVTVIFSDVSISSTANFLLRVGTSGGIVSTGYNSGSWSGSPITGASGMVVRSRDAATLHSGKITMEKMSGNTWVSSHTLTGLTSGDPFIGGGTVTLAAALDRVRITTTSGTDTFDNGSINITWE